MTYSMIGKGDALMDQEQQQDRDEARNQEQQTPANPRPDEQQGTGPFLRQMKQVERQGVPEPGAINPGPPPEPVRSGDFHADRVPQAGQEEER